MTPTRLALLPMAIVAACSGAATPSGPPPVDAALDSTDASTPDPPDVRVDAPLAMDLSAPAVFTCTEAVALAAGHPWAVSGVASGVASACDGNRGPSPVAWGRIEVPARTVLVLRVVGADTSRDVVWLYGDCPSGACLPGVDAARDGVGERRFFNDGAMPRTVWVAARAGYVVLPSYAPPPNLRCEDARPVEPGAVVDDDPFPAVNVAAACPAPEPVRAPSRWYRVSVPGTSLGPSTLLVTSRSLSIQLYTGCDPSVCRVASYLDPYASRYVLRWTNRSAMDATVYLAASADGGSPVSPFTLTIERTRGDEGDTCGGAIGAPTSYDRREFATRWGAETVPVCGDASGRSMPVRWFQLWLEPGWSVLASAFELSSIARPVWQMYAACGETRCLASSNSSVFANALEHTNATDSPERIYLALGNLAPSYVDRLRVRVRAFRAAANDRCETARRVAPNAILTGEDLTTGRTGPPRCLFTTRERRALWYVTRVDPGHRFDVRVVNASEPDVTVTLQRSCDAAGCGIFDVNRGAEPVDVYYTVSQDTVPGLYATYDLVTLSPAAK